MKQEKKQPGKLKMLAGYYKPYRGLFFADLFFAFLGAAVTLVIPLMVRYIMNFPAGMMQKLSASFPMTAFRLHRQEEIMLFTWIRGQEMIQMMEAV